MFPVRCYTCNAVLAHHHPSFSERRRSGEDVASVLTDMGVVLMCCRRMLVTHVDSLVENQLDYPNTNVVLDRGGTTLYRHCRHAHDISCD